MSRDEQQQQPERLLDGPLPDDVASMLRSADRDDPPADEADQKKRRIVAAVVASAAIGGTAETTPSHARSSITSTALKALSVVSVMVVVGVGVLLATRETTREAVSPPAHQPTPATTVLLTPPTATTGETAVAIPSMRVDELPSANRALTPPTPPSSQATPATIEDELRAIDAARAALHEKKPAEALASVDRYRTTFAKQPRFSAEADAIEIQALAALGRMDEARAKAERFFATNPNSPYTQRVRTATATIGEPSK